MHFDIAGAAVRASSTIGGGFDHARRGDERIDADRACDERKRDPDPGKKGPLSGKGNPVIGPLPVYRYRAFNLSGLPTQASRLPGNLAVMGGRAE